MALNEALTLNGLALNSGPEPSGAYTIEEVDLSPPKKKPEWVEGADSDGAGLAREPLYENRTVTAKIRIEPQTTMNTALEKLAAIVDQLQEAAKNPGGIPLVWTPAQSTKTGTMFVLEGEPTGLPIEVQGDQAGWFVKAPIITLQMICKPFIYGEEEEVRSTVLNEAGLSVVTFTLPSIKGDVAAEGRLVVTDTAAIARRYLEWGLEQRYYNAAVSLILAAEAMTPVGGVRSEAANAGAYSPASAKKTIATTLVNEPTICANTGVLKHVGTFLVRARVQVVLGAGSLADNVKVRLSYQDGEGPQGKNPWQTPNLGGKFVDIDLGIITTTTAVTGTQKWLGQIEAYSENGIAKDVFHVNYLTFIPVGEGYGKARGQLSQAPGTIAAFDNFTTGTLSGSLNARTPAVGAAWAATGSTTDFTVEAGQVKRATASDASPRYAVVGAALGNSRASLVCSATTLSLGGTPVPAVTSGVILRWVDANNYAFCRVSREFASPSRHYHIELGVKVAGTIEVLASVEEVIAVGVGGGTMAFNVTLSATTDGALSATGFLTGETHGPFPAFSLAASSAALATGGALASGKGGFLDENAPSSASTRRYSLLSVTSLPAIPAVIQPSQSLEVRSDSTIAEDSSGTYAGPVPEYRGSRFYVPQAGSAKRTSRIIVRADRNDLEESDQQAIGDAFGVQVFVTPRYTTIPR